MVAEIPGAGPEGAVSQRMKVDLPDAQPDRLLSWVGTGDSTNGVANAADPVHGALDDVPTLEDRGGSKPMPMPAGIPVAMMSSGSSVILAEVVSISSGIEKIRFARRG